MRGVGPAGRLFTAPKVRGRSMVVRSGGSIKVGGRTLQRTDYRYPRRSSDQPMSVPITNPRHPLRTANFRDPHNRSITRIW